MRTRPATQADLPAILSLHAELPLTDLGKQLMAAALDLARDAGCYKVMLLTGSSNPDTHAFYRSCGFEGDTKQGYVVRW